MGWKRRWIDDEQTRRVVWVMLMDGWMDAAGIWIDGRRGMGFYWSEIFALFWFLFLFLFLVLSIFFSVLLVLLWLLLCRVCCVVLCYRGCYRVLLRGLLLMLLFCHCCLVGRVSLTLSLIHSHSLLWRCCRVSLFSWFSVLSFLSLILFSWVGFSF